MLYLPENSNAESPERHETLMFLEADASGIFLNSELANG